MLENKRTGSMVCPKCGKLISINSEECYNCGNRNPGLWGFAPLLRRLFGSDFNLIKTITIFSAIIYIISMLLDPSALLQISGLFSLLSPSNLSVFKLGATGTIAFQYGRWWSLITAIFLHGGLIHIALNMYWVHQIGSSVEPLYGSSRFIIIFIFSGVIGFIASVIGGHALTLGASGSLFGLLGALLYYGKRRGGYIGETIYKQAATYAAIFFIFGFLMDGIDNYAHGGGLIGGYLVAMLVGFSEHNREKIWHKLLALALILITILSFLYNLFTMNTIR